MGKLTIILKILD